MSAKIMWWLLTLLLLALSSLKLAGFKRGRAPCGARSSAPSLPAHRLCHSGGRSRRHL